MDFFTHPLVALFILAPIASAMTFVTSIWIEHAKKKRAFHRLSSDPFVYPGAILQRLKGSGDVPIIDAECMITLLAFGRMEITVIDPNSDENGCIYTFRGREFEELIPVFKVEN